MEQLVRPPAVLPQRRRDHLGGASPLGLHRQPPDSLHHVRRGLAQRCGLPLTAAGTCALRSGATTVSTALASD
ncbi:MAG: hypothetical protein ACK56I_22675, partial [bacterium]